MEPFRGHVENKNNVENDKVMDESYSEKHIEVQALTKYGHSMLLNGSHVEASETFLNAYQIAKQVNDLYVLRGCCFNLGACYVAGGQPKIGLKYLEMAIPPVLNDDGLENFSDLWYNIGVARHAVGDIKEAVLAYEKAQEGYSNLNLHKLEAECFSKLAVCYHLLGRLKDSQSAYYKAHEAYESLGDRNNQALCLVSLTGVFSELKDIDGCAKILDILLDVCQEIEDHSLQAKIYHDIGLLYISEKLYESAAECFEQSLKSMSKGIATSIDKHLEATVLQNLGAVCNYMCSYNKAIEYHQKAIDIYGEISDRQSQTQVFGNLGFAYTQIDDYENAIMAFNHAIRAAKDSGDNDSQCLSTEGLAAIYFRMGDYEKSVVSYKEALTLISINTPSVKNTSQSERIVAKLSDALLFQVESKQQGYKNHKENNSISESSVSSSRGKASNTMRYFQDKQHSLIAKGLEAYSSEGEEAETAASSEYSREEAPDDERKVFRGRHDLNTIPENGMSFSMKPTLGQGGKNYYEQPNLKDNEVPRALKEYYLAKVCQENVARKDLEQQSSVKKESSKMCAVM